MKRPSFNTKMFLGAAATTCSAFASFGIFAGKSAWETTLLTIAGLLFVVAIEVSFLISDRVRTWRGGGKDRPYTTVTLITAVWIFFGVYFSGLYYDGFALDKRASNFTSGIILAGAWAFTRTLDKASKRGTEAIRWGARQEDTWK